MHYEKEKTNLTYYYNVWILNLRYVISLNHTASEVQVECNRIYSNCRGAAFTRCRTCFRRQSYGDFSPIPNNRAKSSPTCCDTIRQMRQTALTPQNPVASKLIFPFYFAVSKELLQYRHRPYTLYNAHWACITASPMYSNLNQNHYEKEN